MPIHNLSRRATVLGSAIPTSAPIYVDSDDNIVKVIPAGSGTTEVQLIDASSAQTLTNKILTAPTQASPVITGDAGTGAVFAKTVLFTEDATSVTHTGTIVVPAGATLLDVYVVPQVLWTDSSAAITVGDAGSANGWFTSTNLAATDLVLGERLQASQAVSTDGSYGGGKEGSYVTTAGRFGQQATNMIGGYCPSAYSVIGVVAVTTPSGTAGRTRMTVLWTVGQTVAPVLA
jgi:hypothetical protein